MITYKGKQYTHYTSIHQALRSNVPKQLFTERITKFKAKGIKEVHAIELALMVETNKNKIKFNELTCQQCKKTKPADQFEHHNRSVTRKKTKCISCSSITSIKPKKHSSTLTSILGSMPLGNATQIHHGTTL